MQFQALIFGLLLGGLGVVGWDAAEKSAVGVPHASGVPDKDLTSVEQCCLIPANRGLLGGQP